MNISLDIVHGTAKYIKKMKQTDNFKFVNLPFERGEIFFSKGFFDR